MGKQQISTRPEVGLHMSYKFTPVAITVAGRSVVDAAGEVIKYLEGSTKNRIYDFDFDAFKHRDNFARSLQETRITSATISAAKRLRGRIALKQTEWFLRQEVNAPWADIRQGDSFLNADPSICNGSYDKICAVWYSFHSITQIGLKNGVGDTQINKVLHQILPSQVPIFDKKLKKLYFTGNYSGKAKAICADVTKKRIKIIALLHLLTVLFGNRCDKTC